MPTSTFPDQFTVPATDLPAGFSTVASFEAEHSPHSLRLTVEHAPSLAAAFTADEAALRKASEMLGLPVPMVPAGAAYRAAGIELQPAFQVGLIYGMLHRG